MSDVPAIEVLNRQRKVSVDSGKLQSAAERAISEILQFPPLAAQGITRFREISVAIVSNRTIARVHQKFMKDPTPTDVITFEHGELLISAETAANQAVENRTTLHFELVLYIVHGLLHLHGYDDLNPKSKKKMDAVQFALVEKLLKQGRE